VNLGGSERAVRGLYINDCSTAGGSARPVRRVFTVACEARLPTFQQNYTRLSITFSPSQWAMPLGLERPPPAIIRPTLTVKGGRSSFSICQVSVLYSHTMPDLLKLCTSVPQSVICLPQTSHKPRQPHPKSAIDKPFHESRSLA
jgi:hypothetical protein